MKSMPVVLAATAALVLTASAAPPALTASGVGHCTTGEQVVFSCTVKGGKIASLCATGELRIDRIATVKMQYRFGKAGKPELQFPAQPEGPHGIFFLSATGYGGGGEERIRFASGGYDYVIFGRMTAGAWDDEGHREHFFEDGVVVAQKGKVVSDQRCLTESARDGYPKMYDVLEREPFNDTLDIKFRPRR